MKIILSSPIPGEIALLRNMLESAGIGCLTRNEISAGLSPDIPLSEGTPELWIQDDDRLAEALEIKRVWKESAPDLGGDWVCPACGESSEAQFSSCWKCGAARKGVPLARSSDPVESPAPPPGEPEILTAEVDGMIPCISCGSRIKPGVKYCPFCDYTQFDEPPA